MIFSELNIEDIIVEEKKITDYLLNDKHPDGRNKAELFTKNGFDQESFFKALVEHLKNNDIMNVEDLSFGKKYVTEGSIDAPNGKKVYLRTVWIVYFEKKFIKLVTAYPIHKYD